MAPPRPADQRDPNPKPGPLCTRCDRHMDRTRRRLWERLLRVRTVYKCFRCHRRHRIWNAS